MEALAIVEVLGRHGEILHRKRFSALPATIGRGYDADLILDDPHVAAHHLRLEADEEGVFVLTDLGTHNGFSAPSQNSRSQSGTVEIAAGETVRLGHSQIRIWRPNSVVSPEVLTQDGGNLWVWVSSLFWLLAAIGLMGTFSWFGATGPSRDGTVGYWIMLTTVAVLIWSGLWWLSSRASNRTEAYLGHLSVAASMVCLVIAGQFIANTGLFAFNLHRFGLDYLSDVVLGACLAYGVYRHLRLVSRASHAVLGALSVAVVAALLIPASYISSQSDLDKIGLLDIPSTLRPPWMRIAEGISADEFLQ